MAVLPQDAARFDAVCPFLQTGTEYVTGSLRQDPIVEPRCAFPGPGLGSFFVGPEPNTKEPKMTERTATIASRVGLHARPAAIFAHAAGELDLWVTVAHAGEPADEAMDAASILSLMSLGASHGDVVVLRAEGDGADQALDSLVKILETDHDAR
jgi:phosphocarrier protein HPr